MEASEQAPEVAEPASGETDTWEAAAWVYFIWVVIGDRVYCKIGYSTNPTARFGQIRSGIPERPYRMHLVPCLSVEQAQLFEGMFHDRLRELKSKANGEWFTHCNVKYLNRLVAEQVHDILLLFQTFGYEADLDRIDVDGRRPVLSVGGYVTHLIE